MGQKRNILGFQASLLWYELPAGIFWLNPIDSDREGLQSVLPDTSKETFHHHIHQAAWAPPSGKLREFCFPFSARCWLLSFPARQEQPHHSHGAMSPLCQTRGFKNTTPSIIKKKYNKINEGSGGISSPSGMALALSRNSAPPSDVFERFPDG